MTNLQLTQENASHTFCIVENGDGLFQSVFPEPLAEFTQLHTSYLDAACYLIEVRQGEQGAWQWGFNCSSNIAKELWNDLGEVPVTDEGSLELPWLHFGTGVAREQVWHWFEETFDLSVAADLMNKA